MTPPTTPPTPNQVLRAWRETHHLTRAQMADALTNTPTAQHHPHPLRCHPTLIAKWETGHIRWPTPRYRQALHDLTGLQPTDLGFTPPTPPTPHRHGQATPATGSPGSPSPPPTGTDLHAIDDLAALACLLHARGYTTHLATTLPCLTIHHPSTDQPLHITATGPHFRCEGTAFCQRPPATPLALAADALPHPATSHQDTTPMNPRPGPLPPGVTPGPCTLPTPDRPHSRRLPAPAAQPTTRPPHDIITDLATQLSAHGIPATTMYTAASHDRALLSLPQTTIWTNGHTLTWTHHGQPTTWPAHDTTGAAARLAQLTHQPTPPPSPGGTPTAPGQR